MDSMPTNLEDELISLYDEVTDYASGVISNNYRHRLSKTVFRASPNEFWVKQKSFSLYSSKPGNFEEFIKYLSVRFERTRVVKIIKIGDVLYLFCSCCEYEQYGYPCGCIFAVVDEAPRPEDVIIRWHKSYYVMYLTGNPQLDRAFDSCLENENPGVILPADSVEMFHSDLAVGACTTSHKREYFESTLPTKPPKLHPGVMWATKGPYASTVDQGAPRNENKNTVGTAAPGIETVVALSQKANADNFAYFGDWKDDTDSPMCEDGEEVDKEYEVSKMDESMDTYATKSPDRLKELDSPIRTSTNKKRSAMQATKANYEATCNAIGSDQVLIKKLNDALSAIHVEAMEMHRSKGSDGSTTHGMQSFPAIDRARTSTRLESCPTGNNAARKAKKRTAKKPPPSTTSNQFASV
jgi:hypothetical protein